MGTEKSRTPASRIDELDAFWDLSDIVPKRRKLPAIAHDTEPVTVCVGDDGAVPAEEKIRRREADRENGVGSASGSANCGNVAVQPVSADTEQPDAEMLPGWDMPATADGGTETAGAWAAAQKRDGTDVGFEPHRQNARLAAAKKALAAAESKYLTDTRAYGDPMRVESHSVSGAERTQGHEAEQDDLQESDPSVPLAEYSPDWNPMLNCVSVYQWPARYTFYGRFRSEALTLWKEERHAPCAYVPFFSFMPLPHQLGEQQRAYYLFWREELMRDNPLTTDFSYILLFIYEIINLPDRIAPKRGIHFLCLLWNVYRASFPKLDRYLTEWVCDYCLIHNVQPELTLLRNFYPEILDLASFKEFYIGCGGAAGEDPYAEAVFAYASDYNWHSTKYLTQENRKMFETHMRRAFMAAFERFCAEESNASGMWAAASRKSLHASLTRDSYSGALCAYDRKRRITVVYKSCMRTPELRFFVTGLIKYIENQIRSLLGVKSRFHVQQLDPRMKEAVDRYFEPYRRRAIAKRQEPSEPPAYEKQYDAAEHGFDAEKALRIEALAWNTTDRLTAAFSEETESAEMRTAGGLRDVSGREAGAEHTANAMPEPTEGVVRHRTLTGASELPAAEKAGTVGSETAETVIHRTETAPGLTAAEGVASGKQSIDPAAEKTLSAAGSAVSGDCGVSAGRSEPETGEASMRDQDAVLRTAFGFLLDGMPQAFVSYAGQLNLLPETLAERLNDTAYELLGDIAVEADENGGFRLLPDYREEIEAWMNR